jgi:hypothetical protein
VAAAQLAYHMLVSNVPTTVLKAGCTADIVAHIVVVKESKAHANHFVIDYKLLVNTQDQVITDTVGRETAAVNLYPQTNQGRKVHRNP